MTPQRRQFRGEHKVISDPSIIERLLAQPVSGQGQGPRHFVPEPKGEHPVDQAQGHLDAHLSNALQQRLGIG